MYLQAVVICCLAIAHSGLCYDNVQDVMNDLEAELVFQTTGDSAPHHELVPLVRPPTTEEYSSRWGTIIVGRTERVYLQAFGANINLWLHPYETVLLTEKTPVYHAQYSATEPGRVAFEEQENAMKNIGQLYVDDNHYASLVIGTDPFGKTRVNGHIASHGLTVRSVPERVVKEYLRTKRSINETEYIKSNLTYVIVYKTPKGIDEGLSLHAFNRTNLRERTDRSAEEEEIPYTLYPEILVVVDNSLYRKLGNDQTKLLEYLLAFWNGVDLKYRNLERPRIRLSISAIIIATEPRGTPYISDYSIGDGVFDANLAMPKATYFFSDIKAKFAPDTYDIAVTITTQKIGGKGRDADVGLAYTGHACVRYSNMVNSIVLVHDNADFFGIHVAAHEVGHSIGMRHDNDDIKDCKNSDKNIMSTSTGIYNSNSWKFSRCSLDNFDTLLHNNGLKCLYNIPKEYTDGLPRIMPGKLLSLLDVCKANGYESTCHRSSDVLCDRVYCRDENFYCRKTNVAVPEGTPCGSLQNMFCLRTRCTQIPPLDP